MRINRSVALAAGGIAAAVTLTAVGGAEAADLINGHLIEPHSVALGKLTPGAVERLQGQRGPRGFRGPMGHNGLNGANGAQGLPGPAGNQGAPGPTGTAGAAGAPGAPGAPGAQGPQGPSGAPGQSVTTTAEPAGAHCADGGVKLTAVSGTSYVCNGATTTPHIVEDSGTSSGTILSESVKCDTGLAVGGGGALSTPGGGLDEIMRASYPVHPDEWLVLWKTNGDDANWLVYVICMG